MNEMIGSELLKHFEFSEKLPGCYQIGSFAKRVTLHAQQIRAFNLVWALREAGLTNPEKRFGIIGGGLAGMTTAAALAASGCNDVLLFERTANLLHLQRGNRIRYIHPNIFDWPKSTAFFDNTLDLPFLRWKSGYSHHISEEILDQWRMIESKVETFIEHDIDSLSHDGKQLVITWTQPDGSSGRVERDIVILSVGFGYEKDLGSLPAYSYWQNDDLCQPVFDSQPKKFLVTGCGDGGLTEALRLTVKDFNHHKFMIDFATAYSNKELRTTLIEIEQGATAKYRELLSGCKARRDIIYEVGQYIHDCYNDLELTSDFINELKSRKRLDTEVVLNSRAATYINPEASVINRYAVFTLISAGLLRYISGELDISREGLRYRVSFSGSKPEIFDRLVIRHGITHAISKLIPPEDFERLKTSFISDEDDETRVVYYEKDFLRNEIEGVLDAAANNAVLSYIVEFRIPLTSETLECALAYSEKFVEDIAAESKVSCSKDGASSSSTLSVFLFSDLGAQANARSSIVTETISEKTAYIISCIIETKSKTLLDKLLNAEVGPYCRLMMFFRPSEFFEIEPFTVVQIRNDMQLRSISGDLGIGACIEITRPKGFFHLHTFFSARECLRLLRNITPTVDNRLYEKIITKRT